MSLVTADLIDFGRPYTSANGALSPPHITAREAWLFTEVTIFGAQTDTQPQAAAPADTFDGFLQSAVNSFLYGQIYVFPSNVALGNLVSEENRPIHIWNATFAPADVTALLGTGTSGLTLTEPFAVPYTLAPLQEVQYTVAVSLDGPASLNATYEFTIEGNTYTVQVTGVRVVLWPFAPNWVNPVNESLEWMTDAIKSYNGTEQRISLRAKARRRLDYEFIVARTDTQHFDNILFGWQNRTFALPFWQYRCKTTAAIVSNATIIPLDTTDAGFAPGQKMALFRDIETFEVIEIEAVDPAFLQIVNGVISAWPVGSLVYPVAVASLESNVPVTRQTGTALTGSCSFICSPVVTDPFTPNAAPPTQYNGYEVITYQHDWASGLDNTQQHEFDVIDFETGDRVYAVTDLYPNSLKAFRWLLKSRAQVRQLRELLGRLKGQKISCYIPSWNQDMSVTLPITSLGTTLTVRDRNFFTLIGANIGRAHLMIQTKAGDIFYRPIASVGKTGLDLQVNIGMALGLDLQPEDFRGVYYMQLYRQSADRQVIQWMTDTKAIVEQVFQVSVA